MSLLRLYAGPQYALLTAPFPIMPSGRSPPSTQWRSQPGVPRRRKELSPPDLPSSQICSTRGRHALYLHGWTLPEASGFRMGRQPGGMGKGRVQVLAAATSWFVVGEACCGGWAGWGQSRRQLPGREACCGGVAARRCTCRHRRRRTWRRGGRRGALGGGGDGVGAEQAKPRRARGAGDSHFFP